MINLAQLINSVKQLKLPQNSYVIYGSAPMLAHGILKQISDIDIVANKLAWQQALRLGNHQEAPKGDNVISLGQIDIYDGWMGKPINDLIKNSSLIEGLPFASLQDVLSYKLELNRLKDQEHIKLIKEALQVSEGL